MKMPMLLAITALCAVPFTILDAAETDQSRPLLRKVRAPQRPALTMFLFPSELRHQNAGFLDNKPYKNYVDKSLYRTIKKQDRIFCASLKKAEGTLRDKLLLEHYHYSFPPEGGHVVAYINRGANQEELQSFLENCQKSMKKQHCAIGVFTDNTLDTVLASLEWTPDQGFLYVRGAGVTQYEGTNTCYFPEPPLMRIANTDPDIYEVAMLVENKRTDSRFALTDVEITYADAPIYHLQYDASGATDTEVVHFLGLMAKVWPSDKEARVWISRNNQREMTAFSWTPELQEGMIHLRWKMIKKLTPADIGQISISTIRAYNERQAKK